MKTLTEKLLNLPLVEWEKALDETPSQKRADIASELAALVQEAARLYAYAQERYGYGCGDRGHADAVKTSNRLVTKIRKAMGFSYPRQDRSF